MAENVTIAVPDDLMQKVRSVAAHSERTSDEVLLDWVRRASVEPILELLSDEELLAIADSQFGAAEQEEFTALLEENSEGTLTAAARDRLDNLMQEYRRGLVRKAQAIKLAVSRGLRERAR